MENASKALIMAGSVLIGVIVVSLFMVMANSLTDYQQTQTQNQREAQIISFNNSYEGYIRDNVKGYELMSLVNKVVDYNKRQSSQGTAKDEQGQDLGFDPIELTIDFGNANNRKNFSRGDTNELFNDDKYEFNDKKNINSKINFDEKVKDILEAKLPVCNWGNNPNKRYEVDKTFKFTEEKLQGLLDNYDTIFAYVDLSKNELENVDQKEKLKALKTFNLAFGENYFQLKEKTGNTLNDFTDEQYWYVFSTWLKKDVDNKYKVTTDSGKKYSIWKTLNIYYEYDQFKRAEFKCDRTQVEYSSTGRIKKLYFNFTGKID